MDNLKTNKITLGSILNLTYFKQYQLSHHFIDKV